MVPLRSLVNWLLKNLEARSLSTNLIHCNPTNIIKLSTYTVSRIHAFEHVVNNVSQTDGELETKMSS